MERHGEAIDSYPVKTLSSGITFRPLFPGMVPEIEEREACRFNGYKWKEWLQLEKQERVDGIACYRLQHFISMNQHDAQARDVKRQQVAARQKQRH